MRDHSEHPALGGLGEGRLEPEATRQAPAIGKEDVERFTGAVLEAELQRVGLETGPGIDHAHVDAEAGGLARVVAGLRAEGLAQQREHTGGSVASSTSRATSVTSPARLTTAAYG